jgi:phosphate:Na+ symporter
VVAWANPGTAFFAFLAAVNLNIATMWLIGLAGLGLRNRKLKSINSILGAIVGIGFLLYGLTQLKRAAAPMQEAEWFASVSLALNSSLLLCFIAGALLRVIIQSSSAIVVILIALCGKGLLGVEQAMMIIHGTGIGIGLSVILLGQGLRGESLRIAYWQAIINACSAIMMGIWMLIAAADLLPSLPELLAIARVTIETDLAIGFLLQMLLCPLIGWAMRQQSEQILARLAPEAAEDELARPRYLDEGALEESEIAMDLVVREQARVMTAIPSLLDRARLDVTMTSGLKHEDVRKSLDFLGSEIAGFLAELAARESDHDRGVAIGAAIARQQALIELVETVDSMTATVAQLPRDSVARMLGGGLIEASDVVLTTLREWLERRDPIDRALLDEMTADRGEQMEGVRRNAAGAEFGSPADQAAVLYATSMFERTMYLARRVASSAPSRQVD